MSNRIAFIVVVDDYHDFDYFCQSVKGIDLSHRELGVTSQFTGVSQYVGVIFNQCSPGDGEITDLLVAAEVTLDV